MEGLNDRSRCPHRFWNRIPDSERELIVEHALEHPALSCREVAVNITDEKGYFVSESSVYRILKAAGLVVSPAFAVQSAKDRFQQPTTHINELWQTDFTYFKITGFRVVLSFHSHGRLLAHGPGLEIVFKHECR
jgi:putative transposase